MHSPLNVKTERFSLKVSYDHWFELNYVKTVYKMKIYSEQLQGEDWK